ncbi:MAG: inositol monophosphatase family protein [Planctomycetota bacterium]
MTDAGKINLNSDFLSSLRETSESAARLGGKCLMKWLGKASVREKGPGDLVTQADLESQELIRDFILERFPDHRFVGEEDSVSETDSGNESQFCWIVDPLDGTTNFVHGMRAFCTSIGLAYNGKLIAGTVFAPSLNECFSAVAGAGATLNGQKIKTSGRESVKDSLLVCSFKSRVAEDDLQVRRFARVITRALSVRRLGSAALNLCYVAGGRLDGYWATSLNSWDVAAGALILQEAGGTICGIEGDEFDWTRPQMVATSTTVLRDELLELLHSVK